MLVDTALQHVRPSDLPALMQYIPLCDSTRAIKVSRLLLRAPADGHAALQAQPGCGACLPDPLLPMVMHVMEEIQLNCWELG